MQRRRLQERTSGLQEVVVIRRCPNIYTLLIWNRCLNIRAVYNSATLHEYECIC